MDVSALQLFTSTTVSELAVKVLAAIAFCIVGRWLIGRVIAVMQAAMNRNNVDPTLTKYLGSIIAVTLNIALVLGILGYFGSTAQPAGGVDVAEAIARLKVAVAAIPNVKSSPAPDAAGHEPRGPGAGGAALLPHRPLQAGVLRHQRGHRARGPGSRLAGAHADADHEDDAGLTAARQPQANDSTPSSPSTSMR